MTDKPPFKVTAATVDVLEVLLSGDDELYGLKIAKATGRASGSIVPILMRLERCGWVTSRWETDEDGGSRGPRRRFYELDTNRIAAANALVLRHRPAAGKAVLRPGLEGA